MKRFLFITILFALLSGCTAQSKSLSAVPTVSNNPTAVATSTLLDANAAWPTVVPTDADFDYYVLALSWAPDYCAVNPDDAQECAPGRKYAFVLHGLWPQYTTGYPSNCDGPALPTSVKAQFPQLYPSDKLFDHEWSKHGTCSGLTPIDYLTLARQFKDQVQIPPAYRAPASAFRTTADALIQDFLQANANLIDQDLAVNCSSTGKYLTELYVCISKDGQPAACGADVKKSAAKSCGNPDFLVKNVR